MRPLELRIRNFRSYFGAEAAFDFRGRRLVGVVGPIGSGKSSLLDAISFALYGKTPTVARGTTALIHQRAGEGAVSLRFEVEGEVWEAVRSLRRKGQSQHALYRYAADEADIDPVETITQEGDVNARVVELLGLEFDAFSRSVLLAQGRFAEFLQAPPRERDKVLKGVFGHDRVDRMREVAKERLGAIGVEIETLAVRVEQLDRVAARIEEHRAAIGAAEERLAELAAIEPELAALADTAAAAANEVAAAEQRLTELRELARRLPEPAATGRLLTEAANVATRRKALAAELEKAQAAAATAEAGLTAAVEAGIATQLERGSSLAATIDAHRKADAAAAGRRERLAKQVTKAEADRTGAAQRVAAAQQALAETEERVATAAAGVEQARQALHAAEHANMAEVLRAGLRVGEPCPVCAREVAEMPPAGEGGDLDPARSDLERARRAHDEAAAALTRAAAEAQGATERLSSLEDGASALAAQLTAAEADSEEAAAALETATAEFRDLLGDGEPQQVVEARREEYRAIQEAAAQARKAVDRVRSEHDQVIEDQQGAAKEVGRLRVELAEMAARLDVPLPFEDDAPQAVGAALGTLAGDDHRPRAAPRRRPRPGGRGPPGSCRPAGRARGGRRRGDGGGGGEGPARAAGERAGGRRGGAGGRGRPHGGPRHPHRAARPLPAHRRRPHRLQVRAIPPRRGTGPPRRAGERPFPAAVIGPLPLLGGRRLRHRRPHRGRRPAQGGQSLGWRDVPGLTRPRFGAGRDGGPHRGPARFLLPR
jgi:exonuclease SbcC